jgi:cell pole-organizing protein PopZ
MAFWSEEKKTNAEPAADESIEQALQNIRNTIASENKVSMGDVLELTEVVEEEKSNALPQADNERKEKEEDVKNTNSFESILLNENTSETKDRLVESILHPEVKAKSQDMLEQFLHKAMPDRAPKGEVANSSGISLEDFAREILRKEIAAWINSNLPDMVREVIEREIKNLMKQG